MELGQVKPRSPELDCTSLHHGNIWHQLLLPKDISRKLEWKQSSVN